MTYDLRRLRQGGLIRRLPHTNRYTLTPDGVRLTFTGLKQYTDLEFNKDPGVPIVLAAFVIGLSALLLSLYLPLLGREDRLEPSPQLAGD